jgi:hypothetical protein
VKGKYEVLDYSPIAPSVSLATSVHYTLVATQLNTKLMQIKDLTAANCFYIYDGFTSTNEAVWWIIEYDEDTCPRDLEGATPLPDDAFSNFNDCRLEALRR